ncbi:MAG: TOBE domain-containing protein, partial [Clostridia bacterium]
MRALYGSPRAAEPVAARAARWARAGPVDLAIRPEHVMLGTAGGARAIVERRAARGPFDEVVVGGAFGRMRAFVLAEGAAESLAAGAETTVAFQRVLAYRDGHLPYPASA